MTKPDARSLFEDPRMSREEYEKHRVSIDYARAHAPSLGMTDNMVSALDWLGALANHVFDDLRLDLSHPKYADAAEDISYVTSDLRDLDYNLQPGQRVDVRVSFCSVHACEKSGESSFVRVKDLDTRTNKVDR